MKLTRSAATTIVPRLALIALLAFVFGSCSLFHLWFGKPAAVSMEDGGASAAGGSVVSRFADAPLASTSPAATLFEEYTQGLGTLVGTYTPDVMKLPIKHVAVLQADSRKSIPIIDGEDVAARTIEVFDLTDAVAISSSALLRPGFYEMLYVDLVVGRTDVGGEPARAHIEVEIPGMTDAEISDKYAIVDGEPDPDQPHSEYLGDNRFRINLDTYTPWGHPNYWVFTANASVPEYHRADRISGTELLEGNPYLTSFTTFNDIAYARIPFDGVDVHDAAQSLSITLYWDLQGILQLYEDNGEYTLIVAPDYLDRFTYSIEVAR